MTTPAVHMAPRADGLEVVWAVSRLARGWVEWKDEGGNAGEAHENAFGFVPQGDRVVRVRIGGMKAGARYRLRAVTQAGDGSGVREEGPWKDFRTLDGKAATTRFVVWNDTHENEETIRLLQAATPSGDFMLWNGDTCNDWTRPDLLAPTLLNPAGQDISNGRPLLVNWGNHDSRGAWAFQMPEFVATPDNRPYYAFRSGPVACVFLHTGETKPDSHPDFEGRIAFEALRTHQTEWLKEVIARPEFRDAPYRVVFCHIPLRWKNEATPDYANGGADVFSKRNRDAWHAPLLKWGAQLVVSGHTHQPAWMPGTEEFPYGQLIGGGPKPQSATWIEASADAASLLFKMKDLGGTVLHEVSFKPLA